MTTMKITSKKTTVGYAVTAKRDGFEWQAEIVRLGTNGPWQVDPATPGWGPKERPTLKEAKAAVMFMAEYDAQEQGIATVETVEVAPQPVNLLTELCQGMDHGELDSRLDELYQEQEDLEARGTMGKAYQDLCRLIKRLERCA